MSSQRIPLTALLVGFACCPSAHAIDRGLYDRYQGYKQYQQRSQQEVLKLARKAARDWDFDTAEEHLNAARNMAYAPDEIRAEEQLIADNRTAKAEQERREREEAERQRREAEEQRQRQEQERRAAQHSYGSPSRGSSGGGTVGSVRVEAECTGACGGSETLRISLSGGPGIISDDNRSHSIIMPGYDGIAGTYSYQVVFGDTRIFNPEEVGTVCSGSVRVSGTKQALFIRLFGHCGDAGTYEY